MRVETSNRSASQSVQAAPPGAVGAETSLRGAASRTASITRWRGVAAAATLAAAAVALVTSLPSAADDALRARPVIEHGALRYEFDTLTGREWLFDTSGGGEPRDVLAARPCAARRLRAQLEERIGVESLDELRGEQSSTVDALHRLGYL